MSAVYGLFASPDEAQQAYDRLKRSGVAERSIVVISSEPFEEYEFSRRDHATWMYWIAGGGGAIGLLAAWLLTSTTQQLWPLNTSGNADRPLGAQRDHPLRDDHARRHLATVVTLLVTAGLPAFGDQLYDPEVSDGYILVGVEKPAAEAREGLRETLEAVGGRVKTT